MTIISPPLLPSPPLPSARDPKTSHELHVSTDSGACLRVELGYFDSLLHWFGGLEGWWVGGLGGLVVKCYGTLLVIGKR